MIRRSKGHSVVEVMTIELEVRAAFSKLVSAVAYYNDDSIDIDKIKAQFKEMTNRAIRDFDQDMRTFPPEMDSDRVIERRYYSR
jgi:hypothetical protein